METIADWLVSNGSALLMIIVMGSWLASIRSQKTKRAISIGWFALPTWTQVIIGFVAIAVFIWLGFLLWIPLPLSLSEPGITTLRSIGLFLTLWVRWALGVMYGVSTSSSAPLQELLWRSRVMYICYSYCPCQPLGLDCSAREI